MTTTATIVCVVLLLLQPPTDATSFYISPSANCTLNENSSCLPLSSLYDRDQDGIRLSSNTIITFSSGVHLLMADIEMRDVEDLTLIFELGGGLHCRNRSGIVLVNITNLTIVNLNLSNCGAEISERHREEAVNIQSESILKIKKGLKAAIFALNIRNFHMSHATINDSHGYGLLAINVVGNSSITDTLINSSNTNTLTDYCKTPRLSPSRAAPCHGGNALFLYNDYPNCPESRDSYTLTVDRSTFSHSLDLTENFDRYISQGYGLAVVISQIYYDVHVRIINSTFTNNTAKSFGSNMFIRLIFSDTKSTVSINKCQILHGSCSYCNIPRGVPYSSLVFLYGLRVPSSRAVYKKCPNIDEMEESQAAALSQAERRQILVIADSKFYANHGGAIYVIFFSHLVHTRTYRVTIQNCTLSNNKATKSGGLYVADISPRPENTKELEVLIEGTTFEQHITLTTPYIDTQPNTNLLLAVKKFTFRDCTFRDNDATAIMAHDTSLHFEGVNVFEGNRAKLGAAIELTGVSILYLLPNTQMIFDNNSATERGGAMYLTGGSEESYFFDCQIQVFDQNVIEISRLNITMTFTNNTAIEAGDAVYGGQIDACYTSAPSRFLYTRTLTRSATFDAITNFARQRPSTSIVSSDALRICFCFEKGRHNCSVKEQTLSKYPGEQFGLTIVGVGQREGTVPTVALAYSRTSKFRNSQQTERSCTETFYRVESNLSLATEYLYLIPNSANFNNPRPIQVTINLLNCSNLTGFELHRGKRVCTCVPVLQKRNMTCDIDTKTIKRQPPYWLGNYSNHLLLHDNCPYDYCKTTSVQIVMREPNISDQCAFDRYGILCGSCREGLSQVFGTSRCLECSNIHLLLIIPFALAGIALVAFLFVLNLTVSVGTINGLIFYANIVKINEAIFFPAGDNSFFRVFISWLNLDLGIETCLYDGMTSLVKVSLQFVFPFYLWLIVGVTILAFRHSTKLVELVRVTGNHSVSVLATVFLLSFTKLLRTIISALSLTVLQFPDGERAIWLYDGNIRYGRRGHLALLLFSLFLLLTVGIPYALLIFTVQFLRRYSSNRFLRWVNKLMPIFDAYLGPYKPKQGYWTGLLLFVRVILVIVFTINVFGSPAIDIFVVSVITMLLVLFNLGQGGVYNRTFLTILELSYIVNLGLLAAATALVRQIDGKQRAAVVYTSTAVALATFAGTLVYHVKVQIMKWKGQWKRHKEANKRTLSPMSSEDYESSYDRGRTNSETSWKQITTSVVVLDDLDTES